LPIADFAGDKLGRTSPTYLLQIVKVDDRRPDYQMTCMALSPLRWLSWQYVDVIDEDLGRSEAGKSNAQASSDCSLGCVTVARVPCSASRLSSNPAANRGQRRDRSEIKRDVDDQFYGPLIWFSVNTRGSPDFIHSPVADLR
jgi:hypothetical protein